MSNLPLLTLVSIYEFDRLNTIIADAQMMQDVNSNSFLSLRNWIAELGYVIK